jgi:hypothetical protein
MCMCICITLENANANANAMEWNNVGHVCTVLTRQVEDIVHLEFWAR